MASDVDIGGELVSRLGDCKETVKPSAYSYGQYKHLHFIRHSDYI